MIGSDDQQFDQTLLRRAFGCFPSGVTAFCGTINGKPEGIVASSFTSVSLDPPLVSVCLANTSTTWSRLSALDRFGLSVLASDHDTVARSLSSKSADRFADVEWTSTKEGAIFVHGATLWLDCSPFMVVEAGDHQIVLLVVEGLAIHPDTDPLVFHGSNFHVLAQTG